MNRDWGWPISIILLGISVWLNHLYYDRKVVALLVIATGIIAINETRLLGTHGK